MPDFSQLNWTPMIGDPTFMGWFITIAYFVSTLLTARVYLTAHQLFSLNIVEKQKAFWLLITVSLLFLGINKQLDLQNLLTALGRYYAHKQGWYPNRRAIQKEFIFTLITILIIFSLGICGYLRKILLQNSLALVGYIFLIIFISLRAASFHHIDFVQDNRFINHLLELSGIFLIGYCAFSVKPISCNTSRD